MHPMTPYYDAATAQLPVALRTWAECGSSYIFGKLGNDLDILIQPGCGLEEAAIEFHDAGWDVSVGEYKEVDGHWFSAKKTMRGPDGPVLVNALVSTDDEWVANMHNGANVCRLLHLAKIPVPKDLRVAIHQLTAELKSPEEAVRFLKPEPVFAPEPAAGESYRAAFYADAAKDFEGA